MHESESAMNMDDIVGPNGAIVLLVFAVQHLYRENTSLRDSSMTLLKKYQERDEEERKLMMQEYRERRRKDVEQ